MIIAITSLFVPLLFSKYDRKKTFTFVLSVFVISSVISAFTNDFNIALICRIIPALFYPAYCSLTFIVVSEILKSDDVQMSVSKILMGVSAGTIVGVPITTFFATNVSYTASMLWFGVVNFIALIFTILFFPTLPGSEASYGDEISKAKTKIFVISAVGLVVLTTGVCISYSYISQFLQNITHIVNVELSITLFLFGISSIIGTWIGGKLLTMKANLVVLTYPFILAIVLLALYFIGSVKLPTIILTVIWGGLDGVLNNILQYWITSAAPDAPEFANGMFFSMMNVGITIGTSIGGFLIVSHGTNSIFIGSIITLIISFFVFLKRKVQYDVIN